MVAQRCAMHFITHYRHRISVDRPFVLAVCLLQRTLSERCGLDGSRPFAFWPAIRATFQNSPLLWMP